MFAQHTRISNDASQLSSYDNQVEAVGNYVFANRFEDKCEFPIQISQCYQNKVGTKQIDQSNQLRMAPTSLNEPGFRNVSTELQSYVPYKVGGGMQAESQSDVSRDFTSDYGVVRYYNPRVETSHGVTAVEDFVRGGISTRSCYRNARRK